MRPRLYISGPISKGNMVENFGEFCHLFYKLVDLGLSPFNPGLSMLLPGNQQLSHKTWIDLDLPWVAVADVVFRIPGNSDGADEECRHAETMGVPVFTRYHDLLAWKQTWEAAQSRSLANGT